MAFSSLEDLIHSIKSPGSSLLKLIILAAITFSVLMIWTMRYYLRFQQKISIHMVIKIIKNYVILCRNSS